MSLVEGLGATVKNGSFLETVSPITGGNGNVMDKEAFLKLLVAQMKYQDPLEPASNTEYIAQFATFSQLEQMQNMSGTMEMSRASSYVGQTVTVRTRMTNGEYMELEGRVDFVAFENGKALLSIDGNYYNISDVYAVVDPEYKRAYDLAMAFARALNALPGLDNLTLAEAEIIDNLKDGYNAMNAYQQSFIANDLLERLAAYVARIDQMRGGSGELPEEVPEEGEG